MRAQNMNRSLDEQREEFSSRRFIAMPIAGTIAWALIGVVGATQSLTVAVWTLYLATGSIFGLGILVSRITGEDLLGRSRPKNEFDTLFMYTVGMAWLVFSIAIPFVQIDPTSLPLTVGILAGLMWLPFSWMIRHWVGVFHAISRTVLLFAAWYLFPDQRFVVLPAIIVAIYLITIAALLARETQPQTATAA